MLKKLSLLVFLLTVSMTFLLAQEASDDRLKELNKEAAAEGDLGWFKGAGLGFDLAGTGITNPRIGGGANRFGIGSLGSFFINYKGSKDYWDNSLSVQLSAQKVDPKIGDPINFTKNMDMLRIASRYGYGIGRNWFASLEANLQTQLLNTYEGNFLNDQNGKAREISKLFSPATLTVAAGFDYKPNDHWSFFISPIGLRTIFVSDQAIANLGIHGTKLENEDMVFDAATNPYKTSFLQVGANAKIGYKNTFWNDRITYQGTFDLFSNYLNNPQNMDVLWQNNLGIQIYKGLSLTLFGELFYDHDIMVNVDRNEDGIYNGLGTADPANPGQFLVNPEIGRRAVLTGSYYLKYDIVF